MEKLLPVNTAIYDELPISTIIYKIFFNKDDFSCDYKIVYGNKTFVNEWKSIHGDRNFLNESILESKIVSDDVLKMMEKFTTEEPHSFFAYVEEADIHVHFQPIKNLPAGYGGFFMTNISEYEKTSSRMHFLSSIRKMETAGVLLREKFDGSVECVFASKNFADMMECSETEAVEMMSGRNFILTTHSDDRLDVKRMMRRRISEDGKKFLVIRKITAQKNEIWCKVYYSFIDDFDERYVYCTYFDVTSSRIYAERLRTAYMTIGINFYRENVNTLGMFRVNLTKNKIEDIKGKDLFATDSVVRPYSEVIKLRAANYPIQKECENFLYKFSVENLTRKYLLGKTQISTYLFSRRKDGRYCYVKFTAALTRHPISGEIVVFISEQEANNERVENELLNKILAQQFDMVIYISNGKYGVVVGDTSRITSGNIFPVTRTGNYEDYLNNQVIPVLHGDDENKKSVAEALQLTTVEKNFSEKDPYVVNISCLIDGKIYHKRFDFYMVNPQANFYILLESDTTEIQRKQIEQNLQLKEALAESRQANIAKTAFLSRMSHEIRTPMNAIIGLDNIALHDETISPSMKDHLEKIGTGARYLLSLINDILDMSRIESGRITLRNEEFSFRAFIEQIETLVESQCRDKNLKFSCLIGGPIKGYYIGDDTKLKQILINILSNAIKFTDPGGSISLSVECTAQYEGQSNFKFIIKDNGVGMSKEYLPKIFEPFSQEDDTNTSRYGGSGLGLAITKNIVEMMNGTISADSEKGVGSKFTVTLPLKISDRPEETSEDEMRPQDFSVLIVDDDDVACEHAKTILAEVGISSDTCHNGEEAVEKIKLRHARRNEYNLILVDLKMPHKDGIAVTREIRKIIGDEPTVIILTAYDWEEIIDDAISAGVDTFMSKPLLASSVLYEFQQAFHRKKQFVAEEEPVNLEGKRILVVEDMPVNAEIVMMILEMQGMESEHAENGKIAVEMFERSPENYYAAILMDIRMPIMDGLKATEEIRALNRPDAKKIPIIATTANALDEDVQRSLQAGMNAHLAKPIEPEHLFKTLQEFVK